MKKYASAKNLFHERREQKKFGGFSLLRNEFINDQEIQERSRSFNGVEQRLNEIDKDIAKFGKKYRPHTIEFKMNILNNKFWAMKNDIGGMKVDIRSMKKDIGAMKKDIGGMKHDIGGMKNTMDTLLLISFSKDSDCSVKEKIKIQNILKKQRETFLRKFNNSNPSNTINNQINPNIATPIREKKIKTPPKKDKSIFSYKYEHPKISSTINKIKKQSYSSLKINIKKNENLADSYTDDFSSKKSEPKDSQNQKIKTKINSSSVNVRTSFNSLNNKKGKIRGSENKFRMNIDKKQDKKQQKKYLKNKNIYKPSNNLKKEDKKKIYIKFSQEQNGSSSKSQSGKFAITYSKDSSSGDKKDQKDGK